MDDFTEEDLGDLDMGQLIELTGGPISGYKDFLAENDLSKEDLRVLLEAESSGRNRPSVKQFLSRRISRREVKDFLEIAESDIGELENVIGELKHIENIGDVSEADGERLDQDELISLLGGTVSELKGFVEDNNLASEDLVRLLEAEKKVKDRKTAKEFLNRQIEKRDIAKDVSNVEKDLEKLKQDITKLEEDEASSETGFSDDEERAEEMIESLEDGLELLEGLPEEDKTRVEDSEDQETENTDEVSEKDESSEEEEEDTEDKEENNSSEEGQNNTEEDEETSKDESEDSEDDNTDSKDEDEDDEDVDKGREEKLKVIEDLDVDLPEEKLLEMSLRDLKSIKDEKNYRSQLISSLEEFGMEKQHLQNSSTKDLEKLYENMRDKHGEEFSDFVQKDQDPDKSSEEIREEAEEDLEMLMGASKNPSDKSSDEESGSPTEKINDLADSIEDKIKNLRGNKTESDKESEDMGSKSVSQMLEEYQGIENDREAAVKTAHVMKGYLEFKLGIDHELTYKELAEALPDDKKHMEELKRFFQKMHREQYLKNVKIHDINNTIDICQEVVSEL